MSRREWWGAIAVAAVGVAAAVAALLPRQPGTEGEAARWRARAIEAEAEIATLRERVRELEAATSAAIREQRVAAPTPAPPPQGVGAALERPPHERSEAPPDEVWEALVGGALQEQARQRLGNELAPEQLDRVLDRLRELREAAVALEASEGTSRDALRARLQRSVLVMQADQALREELGVGMSELLGDLDEGSVEDVSPAAEAAPTAELP